VGCRRRGRKHACFLERPARCRAVDSTVPIPAGGPGPGNGIPRGSARDPFTRPCKIPGVRRARTKPSVSVQGAVPGRHRGAHRDPSPPRARAATHCGNGRAHARAVPQRRRGNTCANITRGPGTTRRSPNKVIGILRCGTTARPRRGAVDKRAVARGPQRGTERGGAGAPAAHSALIPIGLLGFVPCGPPPGTPGNRFGPRTALLPQKLLGRAPCRCKSAVGPIRLLG